MIKNIYLEFFNDFGLHSLFSKKMQYDEILVDNWINSRVKVHSSLTKPKNSYFKPYE